MAPVVRCERWSKLERAYLGGFPAQAVQVRIVWPAIQAVWSGSEGVKKLVSEVRERLFEMVEADMVGIPGEMIELCEVY